MSTVSVRAGGLALQAVGEQKPAAQQAVLRHNLGAMMVDGTAFSVMVGLGENYFAPFALALSCSEVVAGMLASVPIFVGACMQMLNPWLVRRLGSNRRWVVLSVLLQAASLLVLFAGACRGQISTEMLFVALAVYWTMGMASSPAWSAWAATLVPKQIRARYFSKRTRFCQAGILVGFVGGGLALHWARSTGYVLPVFAGVFLIAALMRLVSGLSIATQTEPDPLAGTTHSVPFAETAWSLVGSREGRLLVYLWMVQFGTQVASPYFTPFMLGHLHFSYFDFMLVTATSMAAKTVAAPYFGIVAQRFGVHRLLLVGGIAVLPLPAYWILSHAVPHLLIVQVMAGVSWAAFELAAFLLFFEAIAPKHRTAMLTIYNFGQSTALILGSLLGGVILKMSGESYTGYMIVFGLSGLARVISVPLLIRLTRRDLPELARKHEPLSAEDAPQLLPISEAMQEDGTGPMLLPLPSAAVEQHSTAAA